MAKIVPYLLLISSLTYTSVTIARPRPVSSQKIQALNYNVKTQERKIKKLRSTISSLELNLGVSNRNYLDTLESKKTIEASIYESRSKLKAKEIKLREKFLEAKKVLTSTVVNSLGQEVDSANILGRQILVRILSKKVRSLKNLIDDNKKKQKYIDKLIVRFNNALNTERELLTVLNEMEVKKKTFANKYLGVVKRRDLLKTKISKLRTQSRLSSKKSKSKTTIVKMKFQTPLENYQDLEYNKKGITYKFTKRQAVLATKSGKIAYLGTLSNYGKVIMIDHGKNTMSVIFGQFKPKIKKGALVRNGDILGYTNARASSGSTKGQIYFEVRKKNKAQNTILLMKKKFLAKNNFGTIKS